MTTVRKCAGCGYKFRALGDERYCCATCEGAVGALVVLDAIRRYAAEHPAPLSGGTQKWTQ